MCALIRAARKGRMHMNRRGMLLAALLVALLAVAALAPAAAMAEGTEDVKIDETNFPDDRFGIM